MSDRHPLSEAAEDLEKAFERGREAAGLLSAARQSLLAARIETIRSHVDVADTDIVSEVEGFVTRVESYRRNLEGTLAPLWTCATDLSQAILDLLVLNGSMPKPDNAGSISRLRSLERQLEANREQLAALPPLDEARLNEIRRGYVRDRLFRYFERRVGRERKGRIGFFRRMDAVLARKAGFFEARANLETVNRHENDRATYETMMKAQIAAVEARIADVHEQVNSAADDAKSRRLAAKTVGRAAEAAARAWKDVAAIVSLEERGFRDLLDEATTMAAREMAAAAVRDYAAGVEPSSQALGWDDLAMTAMETCLIAVETSGSRIMRECRRVEAVAGAC